MSDNVVKFTGKAVREVVIRPQTGAYECDVVTIIKGEEDLIVECRNWQDAVAWARAECDKYGFPHDFPDERPADT
jgi:hypothetical protein